VRRSQWEMQMLVMQKARVYIEYTRIRTSCVINDRRKPPKKVTSMGNRIHERALLVVDAQLELVVANGQHDHAL
jgi:hypothetical protein